MPCWVIRLFDVTQMWNVVARRIVLMGAPRFFCADLSFGVNRLFGGAKGLLFWFRGLRGARRFFF